MKILRVIVPTLLLVSTAAWAEGKIHEVRPLSPHGSVEIENIAGSIRVVGWNRDEVEITGRLGRGTENLEIDSDEDSLSIEVVMRRSSRSIDAEGTDLELRVPRGISLEIETVSASVHVEDLTGVVWVEAVAGNIRVLEGPEEVEVECVSGRIEVEAGRELREASLETISGHVTLEGDFHPSGEYDLETISGTLELRIPRGLCAEFDVETFSGKIENELGPGASRTSEFIPAQELSFSTCSGGAEFSVSSFSGKVLILER